MPALSCRARSGACCISKIHRIISLPCSFRVTPAINLVAPPVRSFQAIHLGLSMHLSCPRGQLIGACAPSPNQVGAARHETLAVGRLTTVVSYISSCTRPPDSSPSARFIPVRTLTSRRARTQIRRAQSGNLCPQGPLLSQQMTPVGLVFPYASTAIYASPSDAQARPDSHRWCSTQSK
jgi:hypothetical protein